MSKRTKTFISVFCLLAAAAIIILINFISKKTYFSDQEGTGNTPGNIYNSGLFCENNGVIYFSNHADDGALYSMDSSLGSFKKLYNDKALYINADENYIYYSRNNNKKKQQQGLLTYYSKGLFRVNKNGKKSKMLYEDPVGQLILYDNFVYYQHYSDKNGLELYRVGIDGLNGLLLNSDAISPAGIRDGILYYTGVSNDLAIHAMQLTSASSSLVLDSHTYMPIPASDGIYYISTKENYSICHIDYSGNNKKTLVGGMCSTYNISGDERYIYYQRDGGDDNGLCVYDTVNGTETLILPGDYKWINVTSEYVFFYDFYETTVYVYTPDGNLDIFTPPAEAE